MAHSDLCQKRKLLIFMLLVLLLVAVPCSLILIGALMFGARVDGGYYIGFCPSPRSFQSDLEVYLVMGGYVLLVLLFIKYLVIVWRASRKLTIFGFFVAGVYLGVCIAWYGAPIAFRQLSLPAAVNAVCQCPSEIDEAIRQTSCKQLETIRN
ncbi:MAG: hypothetical protein KDD62_03405 [Bdellovibrionales bacterium]|nr:hypothetical protein [Bdellovibrionales bacterium]